MSHKDIVIKKIPAWVPPENNDARVLGMPNIYYAVQSSGMQPRTILGTTEWNKMRKLCYFRANYTCEACGEYQGPGKCQAHELFETDWTEGKATFVRLVCLCEKCHLGVIHSGRALTMYQQGDWRMPKSKLLSGVEHGFKVVHDWNEAHPDQEPILLYSAFVSYLEEPTLKEDMERLFKQYGVKLYGNKKPAEWGKWRMIYNGKEYPTPYKDKDDYIRQIRNQYKVENKKIEDSAKRREKAVADLAKALE